jgi:DNA-binding NarL/FixJ family response regulator
MSRKLTIAIADDHPVVRKGMMRLLGTFERVERAYEAANGNELLASLKTEKTDAVILDVEMPGLNGLATADLILLRHPDTKVLILTMHNEDGLILKLMDQGVHGILNKTVEPDELEKALYAVVDKDFFKSEVMMKALRSLSRTKTLSGARRLSHREMEVLLLICQELSPTEISERLDISEKTFFNHRYSIVTKTGSRTNIGLYKFAVEHGFLE